MSDKLTFGSLFAGIGGFDLGLERAGFECRWQVESNKDARRVLGKHWPNTTRGVDVLAWPEQATEWVDLICGGDPCQENSRARQTDHCRHKSLGGEFIRIVDEMRPRFVLRENPTRVRRDAPWPWYRFRAGLERLGYAAVPIRLRACCFGLDHQRDRLFVLAEVADTTCQRQQIERQLQQCIDKAAQGAGKDDHTVNASGWSVESRVRGAAYGVPDRMERLTQLGNALPPVFAEWIGRRIVESATDSV